MGAAQTGTGSVPTIRNPSTTKPVTTRLNRNHRITWSSTKVFRRGGLRIYRRSIAMSTPMNANSPPKMSQTKSSWTRKRAVGKSNPKGLYLWTLYSTMPMVVAMSRNRKPQKRKKCIIPG